MESVQFFGGNFFNRLNNKAKEKIAAKPPALDYLQSFSSPEDQFVQRSRFTEEPSESSSIRPESLPATSPTPSRSVSSDQPRAPRSGKALERDFIQNLQESDNPEEKAALAEILGRAGSIEALPVLVDLLNDDEENTEVRTAAAEAIGAIGSGTNPNSYTVTELSGVLLDNYQRRKAEMVERLAQPTLRLPFADRRPEETARKDRMTELKTLLLGISRLNTKVGQKALQQEYQNTIGMTLMDDGEVQQMIRATELAEEEFQKDLEKKYQRPASELLAEIPRNELEAMKKKVLLKTPQGKTIDLLEALAQIAILKEKQAQFGTELLSGLMDALALQNDKSSTAALKLGLINGNPAIKAKALKQLRHRNGLNYNSDIYPNLYARDAEIRKAALKSLVHAKESAAQQKTMELLKPKTFLELMGGFNANGLRSYVKFLEQVAENGDEFIEALSNRALHSDYDLETRQVALLVLGMMTQGPAAQAVSLQTRLQAMTAIKVLAVKPPARSAEDLEALRLTATQLWVLQQDPQAIASAIMLADSKHIRMSGAQQVALLNAVFSVLQADRKKSESERQVDTQHQLLDILRSGKHPSIGPDEEQALRKALPEPRVYQQLNPQNSSDFLGLNLGLPPNLSLQKLLATQSTVLRPFLTRLAESEKSPMAQMLAIRILGVLKDAGSLGYLKERTRDPLKGKIDWDADLSYRGNPASAAANVRLNSLAALGDIGRSEALDVMLDALDDAVLKNFVPEPLGQIAEHANQNASDEQIRQAKTKLVRLMETPNTTRAMRAVRIKAASALYQFKDGVKDIKAFVERTPDPNFRRHALSALLSHDHGLEADHEDHSLVRSLIHPGLGIEQLHQQGVTGKGVQMAIVDGGYVDPENEEAFQDRVKLPAAAEDPEHTHPTMVMSTAAANGKLKGVAPDAVVFSDKWPDFQAKDTMAVYKKMIEGKLRGENDIRVINNSWGFSNPNAILHKDVRTILRDYKKVVDLAEKAGIQMVFAAGNEGEGMAFPKVGTLSVFGLDLDKLTQEDAKTVDYILDKVILAGALNTQGDDQNRAQHRIADFSSRGDSLNTRLVPTVLAPGADMMVYSWDQYKGNPKTLVNGTSFASPYVSGLLSLMLQQNPNLSPAALREILKQTAVPLPDVPRSEQGHGVVDPQAAVKLAASYGQTIRKRKWDSQDSDSASGSSGQSGAKKPNQTSKDGPKAALASRPIGDINLPEDIVALPTSLKKKWQTAFSKPSQSPLDEQEATGLMLKPPTDRWLSSGKSFLKGQPLLKTVNRPPAAPKAMPSKLNKPSLRAKASAPRPLMNPPKPPALVMTR